MAGWTPYVPENIKQLKPYMPGKPIEETKAEFGLEDVIKLASNENPLGPPPGVLEVLSSKIREQHLYPDAAQAALKQKLSEYLGCESHEVSIGAGSNELIDLLPRVFGTVSATQSQPNIVTHEKAFIAYKLCAQISNVRVIETPLREFPQDLRVNVDKLIAAIDENTRLVFIANPNNPTGAFLTRAELRKIAEAVRKFSTVLVLDYAYWEYVRDQAAELDIPSPQEMRKNYPQVAVLGTFSKAFGLAGLRLGYLWAHPEVIAYIEKARQPFNLSSIAAYAGIAALEDARHIRKSIELNNFAKKKLEDGLKKLGLKVLPTVGNFSLVDLGLVAEPTYQALLRKGVIVRPLANYGMPNFLRISVGTEKECERLLSVWPQEK